MSQDEKPMLYKASELVRDAAEDLAESISMALYGRLHEIADELDRIEARL